MERWKDGIGGLPGSRRRGWKSGRRVWFLNENSETLKIHPFLLFEGHDVRNNLEISLGGLTNALNFLYQK